MRISDWSSDVCSSDLAFARIIAPHIDADDLVWVHDYHMIPLGWLLRQQGLANRMGFFLHIPWPPTRLLVELRDHRRLVEALFAYDVIGFQAEAWQIGRASSRERACQYV